MAGTIIDRQLTARPASSVRFALATDEDDAAIRRLLQENPTRGRISLSFEREPDYFRSIQVAGAESRSIAGFLNERLIGVGRCSVRQCHVNGDVRRVGYLSELRLDASVQGRFDILRRGYQFFHELHRRYPADFYFTSIAADNQRSLRFLERNLPGMPRYQFAAGFLTLLIPISRYIRGLHRARGSQKLKWVTGNDSPVDSLVSFLNAQAQRNQLATFWTKEGLLSLKDFGLSLSDLRVILDENNSIVACAGLWDQRSFKQTVVRGYAAEISAVRPLINLAAKLWGTAYLPPLNSTLKTGFVFPFCARDTKHLNALIELLRPVAADCGVEFLTLGFAENDPHYTGLRRQFRAREYRTQLYQVTWDKSEGIVLDHRPFLPEVALL
jgi:hypothetical protein